MYERKHNETKYTRVKFMVKVHDEFFAWPAGFYAELLKYSCKIAN